MRQSLMEATWAICPYLRNLQECNRCPQTEHIEGCGNGTRGCVVSAQSVINIIETGNEWRRDDPLDRFKKRIAGQTDWLRDNAPYCFVDQKHLDENTPERAYWHYGYVVALKDVRDQLKRPHPNNDDPGSKTEVKR